jgi:hypothetical protein
VTTQTTTPDTSQNAPYQLLPPLSPDEYAALKEDIRQRGVCVAIEFDGDGNLLDGHNRLRAWNELQDEGADVPMYDQVVRQFESEEAKRDYVLSINLKRRHLDNAQKAELFYRLRMPPFNMTLDQIAAVANVSNATVWRRLDELPDEVRDTLIELQTIGKDGKVYPSTYYIAERTIIPGEKAERDYAAREYVGRDETAEIPQKFLIVIEVPDEQTQSDILGFINDEPWASEEGVIVKAVSS